MSFMSRMVLVAVLVSMALLACGGPTAPSGTATITITGVSVENGGSATQGLGLDTTLTITASDELLRSSSNVNPYVGNGRLPFYLCLSTDGVHFTSQCQAGLGIGANVQARVTGPSESFGISMTTHLIALVIPVQDYGTPLTAFVRYGAGNTVPSTALAVHVLPWVIHWQPRPAAAN